MLLSAFSGQRGVIIVGTQCTLYSLYLKKIFEIFTWEVPVLEDYVPVRYQHTGKKNTGMLVGNIPVSPDSGRGSSTPSPSRRSGRSAGR